jgi:hypothetical protein
MEITSRDEFVAQYVHCLEPGVYPWHQEFIKYTHLCRRLLAIYHHRD